MSPKEFQSRSLSTSTTDEAFSENGSTLLASPLSWFYVTAVTLRRSLIRTMVCSLGSKETSLLRHEVAPKVAIPLPLP